MSSKAESRRKSIGMTSGSLWKNIFLFSIPLMCSQILEVLFNLSDVAIVGKYAGYIPLGSVGSTTLLVSLFTGFLIGMGGGVNVRVAHKLGVGDAKGTEETVHTAALICLIAGLILCLICNIFAEPFLNILHTKSEFMDGAVLYFRIYALGLPALAIYNFGNGVLSASGETKLPLIYLSIAGVLNVLLNLFFVIHLCRRKDSCRLYFSRLRFHKEAAKSVLMLGVPGGMQNAIFAIANLFVQTGVNSFDAVMVSGNSAAINADTLIFNIMTAFYTACASFMGQNMGAGNRERMIKSYRISLLYSFLAGAIFGGLLVVFGRQFLSLFASKPEVIEAGMERIKIMGFSYALSAFMDCTIAASRGIGKSIVPTIIVIMGSCVFRVIWVYTIFAYFGTIASLYLLYAFSWSITAIAEIIYFKVCFRKLRIAA